MRAAVDGGGGASILVRADLERRLRMTVIFAVALALAFVVGFAAQRGTICAVRAVDDVIARRDPRLFIGFLECALWAFSLAALLAVADVGAPASPVRWGGLFPAALGGALFGLGASLNGACAFGSAARLARGELSFLAMPFGFVLGAALTAPWAPLASPPTAAPHFGGIAAAIAGLFLLIQIVRAARWLRRAGAARRLIAARALPVSAAMAGIGLAGGALALLAPGWTYTALLAELGAHGAAAGAVRQTALYGALLLGAALSAQLVRRFIVRPPSLRGLGEKSAAGGLMGAGAALVPGGNDALLLNGMPHLAAAAFVAYLSMNAAIALALMASAWAKRVFGRKAER
jgi:uncharacterized membrane protein YedE/YeeE